MSQLTTTVGKAPRAASYPGLSPRMSEAFDIVMQGKQPNPNQFFTRRHKFFHRVDYNTTGATAIQLFNVNPAKWICNLPVQGSIAVETAFKLEAVRIWAEVGITSAATYTRAAGGAQGAAAAVTNVTNFEEIRTIFQGGMFTLQIGDKKPVDQLYALQSFPQGGGMDAAPALSTTAGTTSMGVTAFNNGQAHALNVFQMKPPFPLLPGKVINGLLEWQAALAVTTAFIIRVELDGVLLTAANA